MMKTSIILLVSLFILEIGVAAYKRILPAQTKVVAHRGYREDATVPENSMASLQKAQELDIYASEFDVWPTSDGVLLVHHDPDIDGKRIYETPYEQLKDARRANGEKIPLLEEYLRQGKKDIKTKLILDFKYPEPEELEDRAIADIIKLVDELEMNEQITYIATLNVCKKFLRINPNAEVVHLSMGDIPPSELKPLGIAGIDYHFTSMQKNKHWIEEAHKLNMSVNVWTVNDEAVMKEMLDAGVDFITTDKPLVLKKMINEL